MNNKDFFIIWIKTILLGNILSALFGLAGGILGLFSIYLLLIVLSGVCSIPLLIVMLFIKFKSKNQILKIYFFGSLITLLLLFCIFSFDSNDINNSIIPLTLISIYYMLITIIISTRIKLK